MKRQKIIIGIVLSMTMLFGIFSSSLFAETCSFCKWGDNPGWCGNVDGNYLQSECQPWGPYGVEENCGDTQTYFCHPPLE